MKLLDYSFFRIYKAYKKYKSDVPIFMGCAVLSITIFLTAMSLIAIIFALSNKSFDTNNKLVIFIIMISLLVILGKRYNNNDLIDSFEKKYGNEPLKTKRIKGTLLLSYIIVVLLIPIAYGFIKHNIMKQ